MDILIKIFGEGKELSTFQMSCRGIVIFIVTLALLRISGRRSFGLHNPLDNIIAITLGSVLSRAVVGVSPFIPVILTCLVIVLLHRALAWLIVHYASLGRAIEGRGIPLYENGVFLKKNMGRALASEEDILEGIRRSALTEDIDKIQKVYMERSGQVTVVTKKNAN